MLQIKAKDVHIPSIFQSKVCFICKVLVTKIDNNGAIVWSTKIGDAHKTPNTKSYSIGFAIDQVHDIRQIEPFYDGKDRTKYV